MLALGIDPGGHTGMAKWHDGDFHSWEESYPMQAADWVVRYAKEFDIITCEDFRPRPKVTWQPDALHIIGCVRYACWKADVDLVMVQPTNKVFGSDLRLKAAGFYVPGKGHANDAARHLLKLLVRSGHIPLEEVI